MRRMAFRLAYVAGTGAAALLPTVAAQAEVAKAPATKSVPEVAFGDQQPVLPAARSERINPTGRTVVLTVPAKDGATFLGDMPITIRPDDTLLFPADRAFQLLAPIVTPDFLQALKANLAGHEAIGPADLLPLGLRVDYDPRTLELTFVIPVERRASRQLSVSSLDRSLLGDYLKPLPFSAYVNIRGSVDYVEDGGNTGFGTPVFLLDGATRIGKVVLESDAVWTPGGSRSDFQRLGSRLVVDDLKHLVRYSAGDLQVQSRGFQTTPEMAGAAVMRSYGALNPQQIIRPRGDRTFTLERASTVEVLVNGQQVRRLQLAPGNYNLRDFPFAQGANDVRLNVLDDTGRSETLRFSIFLDQSQLAKGLSEFGLYSGVRTSLGPRGPRYSGDWIMSAFYRRGVSDGLTLGANFQAEARQQMGGIEAVLGTPLGTLGTHLAFSHTRGVGDGFALQSTFQRQVTHGNGQADTFSLSVEHRSRRFAPVTFLLPDNPYKYELGAGYSRSFSSAFYSSIDARFSKGRGAVADVQSYRLAAGWRLTSNANLSAEGRYEKDSRGSRASAFVTLNMRLGRESSIRTEYDTRDNRMRASYQTLHGSGVGSYNVTADLERSDIGAGVNVNANYFSNRAELGFSHFGVFDRDFGSSLNQRSTFRMGTSLAFGGGTLAVGRPIYDSFAIVTPHKSLKGAKVEIEPTPYGFTATTGTMRAAVMPGLSSYSERTVPIDVANAPPGADVGQGSFKVFPDYRSGFKIQAGSDYNITAFGTMLNSGGQPMALISGKAVELAHPDRPAKTIFTNRQGRFGATGLAPGKWRIEMLDDELSTFVLDIPAGAEGIVRVGEIKPNRETK